MKKKKKSFFNYPYDYHYFYEKYENHNEMSEKPYRDKNIKSLQCSTCKMILILLKLKTILKV